ncbi:MAG: signal peptidase II, partial [Akkermansia sp.]|nr:signal peptidase II [Akkermansia sp.]
MSRRVSLWLILLIIGLYALDQLTKWAIVLNFPYNWEHSFSSKIIPVIQGSEFMNFCLVRVHNTGVAFGTGHGTVWAPFVFLCVQIVA